MSKNDARLMMAFMSIRFRCWYCNRRFVVADHLVGTCLTCQCTHRLRIPQNDGGNCQMKTPTDWIVETLVYSGGGVLLGLGLAVLLILQAHGATGIEGSWVLIAGLTLIGFLTGMFAGERGINWLGRIIRKCEE